MSKIIKQAIVMLVIMALIITGVRYDIITGNDAYASEIKTPTVNEIDFTSYVEEIKETVDEKKKEEKAQGTIQREELTAKLERYLGTFEATAYCNCTRCCSGTGRTATGTYVTEGRTIAVDPNVIPLGSRVRIKFADGTEGVYTAEDTGGAIKGNIIDVYFGSHERCITFGRQHIEVYFIE